MSKSDAKGDPMANMSPQNKKAILNIQRSIYHLDLMRLHEIRRGSAYNPFNIEPFRWERQRLSGEYTDVDRALRKQFLMGQVLSHNEPRTPGGLYPQNIFRKIYSGSWDTLFSKLVPIVGEKVAGTGRYFIPKAIAVVIFSWFSWYKLTYSSHDWENVNGARLVKINRPVIYPGEANYPDHPDYHRKHDDFHDMEFKKRKALKNPETSTMLEREDQLP